MANATDSSVLRGKKILSLDGGGVRGLSSLLILRYIMKELGNKLNPKRPDIKPCEYFDLIAGTSTGGIIAIMLGRLRMSVQECIDQYTSLSKRIFQRSRPRGSSGPHYYAEDLEDEIRKVIRWRLGPHNEDAPLRDPLDDEACKTFVLSLQDQNARAAPRRLKTYPSADEVPCTIWQAARATSAAKTFFDSITFGNPPVEWVDAGLGYNNPAKQVLDEAQLMWQDESGAFNVKDQIGVFISLGTGIPDVFRPDRARSLTHRALDDMARRFGVPPDVIKQMKDIVLNTEQVHDELVPDFRRQGCATIYHRYNVARLGDINLGDYEKEEIMTVDTNAYLHEQRFNITDCANLMKKLPVYVLPMEDTIGEPAQEERVGNLQMQVVNTDGITHYDFVRASTELRTKSALKQAQKTAVWGDLVKGSVRENRARQSLTDFHHSDMGRRARETLEMEAVCKHVEVQLKANVDLWAAYKHYRRVRNFAKAHSATLSHYSAHSGAELGAGQSFSNVNAWYCWTTHRLAGVSASLGMLQNALSLYEEAWKGRLDLHPWCERDIQKSKQGEERMRKLLN